MSALLLAAVHLASLARAPSSPPNGYPSDYNVRWSTRGEWKGASGSMPLGTGKTGAAAWVEDDALRLLLSATDSYDEYNWLLKLGIITLALEPNPFAPLTPRAPPSRNVKNYTRYPNSHASGPPPIVPSSGPINCSTAIATEPLARSPADRCAAKAAAACAQTWNCTLFSVQADGSSASLYRTTIADSFYVDGTDSYAMAKQYSAFSQTLDLKRAAIVVNAPPYTIEIFGDALADAVRVRVATSDGSAFNASVGVESWRLMNRTLAPAEEANLGVCPGYYGIPANITRHADTVVDAAEEPAALVWYRRADPALVNLVDASLQQQHLGRSAGAPPSRDPLTNNTFGFAVEGAGLVRVGRGSSAVLRTVSTQSDALELQITPLVAQTATASAWLRDLRRKRLGVAAVPFSAALDAHTAHWDAVWSRSWLHITGAPDAFNQSRTAAIGRFVNLVQATGSTPIHFNGGIFTYAANDSYTPFDLDYRTWGAPYWWQNTRFAYDPMLGDGDYDELLPLFDYYRDQLSLATYLVKSYYKHGGAKYYETSLTWGAARLAGWGCPNFNDSSAGGEAPHGRAIVRPANQSSVGCVRLNTTLSDCDVQNTWIRHHYSSAIEVPLMMLRHFLHTGNATAARTYLLPIAEAATTFFVEHWAEARFFLEDGQALESYSHCDQPACDVGGLHALSRGLALPLVREVASASQIHAFDALALALDGVYLALNTTNRSDVYLLPCGRNGTGFTPGAWEQQNREPIMMYAVWPYELLGVNRSAPPPFAPHAHVESGADALSIARRSFERRPYPNVLGYSMDSVFAANLGLVAEARTILNVKWGVRIGTPAEARFPVWFGPAHSDPEVCDEPGCNEIADEARIALQHMLLQSDGYGERLLLFPTWPKDWDVVFKIHAARNTTIEGELKGGVLRSLQVTPLERRRDVVVLL